MKAKGSGNFVNIDIGDMVNVSRYHSIKNFYLSHLDFKEHLFKEGVPFTFNGFYISLCLAGEAGLRISGRSCPVRPGTLLVLAPNQLIEPYHISPDYDSRSIIVSLDEILAFPSPIDINIMNAAVRTPSVNLPGQRPARLLEYYDFLEKQYLETGNAYREEISKTLFYALMLEICDIFRSVSGENGSVQRPRQEKLTDDFLRLMTKYYRTEHNVAFYADRLNRTPKYLSGAIKRLSGRSVSDWINSMLISESKLMLKVTDKSILEISEELNFSSPSVFVQFFRHNTGITPLQYRKQS